MLGEVCLDDLRATLLYHPATSEMKVTVWRSSHPLVGGFRDEIVESSLERNELTTEVVMIIHS